MFSQRGIDREIMFVVEKQQRNNIERIAEAMDDPVEVLQCYSRIQRLMERLVVSAIFPDICPILKITQRNTNMSTWRTVDEQATVRASDSSDRHPDETGHLVDQPIEEPSLLSSCKVPFRRVVEPAWGGMHTKHARRCPGNAARLGI